MTLTAKFVPSAPAVGQAVPVSFFDGQHNVHLVIAHVTAVGQIDEETGLPELTVAYPTLPIDPQVLSSAKWYNAYSRNAGVKHVSHPDVQAGKLSMAWSGEVVAEYDGEVPKPAGDGTNPIFERQVEQDVKEPSIGQAAAIQSGKVPPNSGTPLIHEPQAQGSGSERYGVSDWTKLPPDHPDYAGPALVDDLGQVTAAPVEVPKPAETVTEPEKPAPAAESEPEKTA